MKNYNPLDIKARIEKGFAYYGGQGISPENGILRIEKALVTGTGKYVFDIKKEVSSLGLAERSITRNDLFITTHLLVGLTLEANAKPGQSPILTYPLLGAASLPSGVVGFATRDIEGLYNGGLSIKTNQTVNVSDLPLLWFRKVPRTQPGKAPYIASSTNTNQAAGTATAITNTVAFAANDNIPEFDLTDAAIMLPEEILFAGNQNHTIEINFPCASNSDFRELGDSTSNAAAVYTPKIVFQAFGYRVPGGADEKYKVQNNPYFGRF